MRIRNYWFLIVLGFCMLMMPYTAKAGSVSVSLSCPGAANVGDQITCNVNVSSDVNVNGLSGNYSLSGLSYVNFAPQNGFTTYASSASGFAVGNTSGGKSGNFTIGVITLKVGGAGSIQLTNLDASDVDINSYSIGTKSASIRIKSTNNDLSSLSISPGSLSPAFSASTTSYSATVDSGSVTISATKGDSYQNIGGTGTMNLGYGKNTFNVVVTSESGSSKTYTIVINRPDNRSTNNYLKSLSVNQGSISFNKNTTKYTVNVGSNVSSIKVSAAVEDGTASFVGGYGPRTVNLNYGSNNIQVKVKAQNEGVRTYTITVNRKDDRSTNNNLKSLTLSEGKIEFDKNKLEYNLSVYYDVTTIGVTAVAEDSKASVKVNSPELVVGDNVITIDVTSENQVVKTYKINVKRLSEEEKMSDNNKVSSFKVFGRELKVSGKKKKYEVKIGKNEKELVLDVMLEDERANYIVKGNKNLKNGSVVLVIVTSESGIKNEYEIVVNKENDLLWYVLTAVGGFAVGFGVGFVVSKGKRRNDKKDDSIKEVNEEKQEDAEVNDRKKVKEKKQREEEINVEKGSKKDKKVTEEDEIEKNSEDNQDENIEEI